jgi:hypothetical protein
MGDCLTGLEEDGREGDGTDGIDTGTDCGGVGREGVALDVTGVGEEGSAVKLKSFTVVKFSVCTECCSLSLRDGKCSKRIFNKKAGKKQPGPCDEDQLSVINPAPHSAKKQSFFSSTPISTPQSILKKCKASPSIKPSAAKKIRFEQVVFYLLFY